MQSRRVAWVLFPMLCFLFGAITPRTAAQGTSTPEERAQWVEITHKLESSPLDDSVNKQGESALKQVSDAHDIHVPLCPSLLGEFNGMKYSYSHQITRQYMLASTAFLIENPDKTSDLGAMNLAAVESVLKTYNAILQQKPEAKSKTLDDLLKKQSQGKLNDSIQKQCH
jgi:carboxypeptidase Q